ncbi:hypothetical protein [Streptomyces sp. SCSIO ZS0520]|uniref:hypothetical protein n=1 Tax=Streptomyces sp. SCSIO ZS0520 TaxID=2892996 RepID=UPI0021D9818E|nr:hypothetical protein [Streptomyces sp. SCSIO ZS0520]
MMREPAHRQQIGYDMAGNPMYALPEQPQTVPAAAAVPLAPLQARPWGAYLAGGCLGLLALTVVVVAIGFVVFGLTILAAVLALCVICLTVCLLILRSVFRDLSMGR